MCATNHKDDLTTLAKTFASDVVQSRRLDASGRVLDLARKMAELMVAIGLVGTVVKFGDDQLQKISGICVEAKSAHVSFDLLKGADVDDELFRRTVSGWRKLLDKFAKTLEQDRARKGNCLRVCCSHKRAPIDQGG